MSSALIVRTFIQFLSIYSLLIVVRCLLTWFQSADWAANIIAFLSPITDPYLNLFRSIIPPLGGMDFSPILAIFVLQILLTGVPSF
jgi:YggT family protein